MDDDREKRPQLAAPFELPENRVVVLDQLQFRELAEVLRVRIAQMMPPADERNRALHFLQMLDQQSFGVH